MSTTGSESASDDTSPAAAASAAAALPEADSEAAQPQIFTTDMVFGKAGADRVPSRPEHRPFTTDMVFGTRPPEAGAPSTLVDGAIKHLRGSWASLAARVQVGHASYYHDSLHGRRTANGERYDRDALTAAHRTLPLGTLLRVVNLSNQKTVVVRVNDRGPFAAGRALDLSRAAATLLDYVTRGTTQVSMEVVHAAGATTPAPASHPRVR